MANAAPDAGRGPLSGVRVLDLTRLLPGPMCTLYLAQMGADVIKVEDTGAGDYARTLGAPGAVAAFFALVNRGKRSIALDLKRDAGRAAFLALARTADVIVESFRPGVVQALRVDAAAVRTINPRVVYASISGYGQDGPRAAAAGHDINYLALAGVLDQIGSAGGPPALANLQIADLLGGAAMPAVAILGALYDAQRSGRGRDIDVAMTDAVLAHNVFPLQALVEHGRTTPRGTDLLTGGVPCYGVYATADGRHLAVGALEEKFWRTLCEALQRPDLVPFGRASGEEGERTRSALAKIFGEAPLAHWVEHFRDIDCCVTPVLTLAEALRDAQLVARGMVHRTPDGSPTFGPPFRMTASAPDCVAPAPAQGQHTRELLREAGYDEAAIAALVAQRIVSVAPA
jgi:crotonobetainyl-CoA:carnitine CoA-transferase CaiB-like acyl-CoA transferase